MALKNLANCTPTEFFTQTMLIKRDVEKWITVTDISGIMKTAPELIAITDDMDADTLKEVAKKNLQRRREQGKKNLSRVFDVICEEHPKETAGLLALTCFVPKEEVDSHPMTEYMASLNQMLEDENVFGFFTSLLRWARILIKGL